MVPLAFFNRNQNGSNMEKIYQTKVNNSKVVSAKPETIKFLLDYSKSLNITEAKGIKFENILN
ncbi:hypothetical protein BFP75_10540 [Maribacter sp. 4G9]|nr:hypothetical protein BFP75_10540 [Maribacter sp. 4G9]